MVSGTRATSHRASHRLMQIAGRVSRMPTEKAKANSGARVSTDSGDGPPVTEVRTSASEADEDDYDDAV